MRGDLEASVELWGGGKARLVETFWSSSHGEWVGRQAIEQVGRADTKEDEKERERERQGRKRDKGQHTQGQDEHDSKDDRRKPKDGQRTFRRIKRRRAAYSSVAAAAGASPWTRTFFGTARNETGL